MAMDVDINLTQNNLEINIDNTQQTQNNVLLNVGVDPNIALQLQREADEARAYAAIVHSSAQSEIGAAQEALAAATNVAETQGAKASAYVSAMRVEAHEAIAAANVAAAEAQNRAEAAAAEAAAAKAKAEALLNEGRAAVASARTDAGTAQAAAKAAEQQRDFLLQQQQQSNAVVASRVEQLERDLAAARQAAKAATALPTRPPRPRPKAEAFDIHTPGHSLSREGSHSPVRDNVYQTPGSGSRHSDQLPAGTDAAMANLQQQQLQQAEQQSLLAKAVASISQQLQGLLTGR
jgi:hypothetical protein